MAESKEEYYVSLTDLRNGIGIHQKFPASRLSPFIRNEMLAQGKIKLVISPAALKAEYEFYQKLFHGKGA